MQGDPGKGKTTIAPRIASLLSRGEKLPRDDTAQAPTVVIYQTAEDGLDDPVKPRLIEADADCTKIKVIDESDKALSMLDERIEKASVKENAKAITLDPIQAYVGKEIKVNCANEIRVMAHSKSCLAPEGKPIAWNSIVALVSSGLGTMKLPLTTC